MATHEFHPTFYYTTIGTYEPVLYIESGDTVITTTAGSDDSEGLTPPNIY